MSILGASINNSGYYLDITLANLTASLITGIVPDKNIALTIHTSGFSSTGVLTEKTRSPSLIFQNATASGSNALIRLGLSDNVWQGCNNITFTMDTGTFTDGTNFATGTLNYSVVNLSQIYEPIPAIQIIKPFAYERIIGEFDVTVGAGTYAILNDIGELGLNSIKCVISDGTNIHTQYVSGLSLVSGSNYSAFTQFPVFKFTSHASGFNNKSLGHITVTAFSKYGLSRTVSGIIYFNKNNDFDTKIAYVDNSYSISGSSPNNFTHLEKIVQSGTNAWSLVWGQNQSSGLTKLVIAGLRGAPNNSNPWVGQTSSGIFTPTTTVIPTVISGILNDVNNPYPNLSLAARSCELASSDTKASFSTIYVKTPYTVFPDLGFGSRPDCSNGPIYILPWSGVPSTDIICIGSSGLGLRVAALEFQNHTIVSAIANSTTEHPLSNGWANIISFRNIIYDGTLDGGNSSNTGPLPSISQWSGGQYYDNCLLSNFIGDLLFTSCVNSNVSGIGEDCFSSLLNNSIIANSLLSSNLRSGAHGSIWQTLTNKQNRIAWCIDASKLDITGPLASVGIFTTQGSGIFCQSYLAFNSILFPGINLLINPNTRREGVYSGLYQYGCVSLINETWANTGGSNPQNIKNIGCIFGNIIGDSNEDYRAIGPGAHINCHQVSGSTLNNFGFHNTSGGPYSNLFIDVSGYDYKPTGLLLNRINTNWSSFDAAGQPTSNDLPFIGPLSPFIDNDNEGSGIITHNSNRINSFNAVYSSYIIGNNIFIVRNR